MKSIKFKLHTYDIQNIDMAVLFADLVTMTEEDKTRISEMLLKLNQMCCEENGHTLTVTVEG